MANRPATCPTPIVTRATIAYNIPHLIPQHLQSYNSQNHFMCRGYKFEGSFITINDHYPHHIPQRRLGTLYYDEATKLFQISRSEHSKHECLISRSSQSPHQFSFNEIMPLDDNPMMKVIPKLFSNKKYTTWFSDPFPIEEICKWGCFFISVDFKKYYILSYIIPSSKDSFIRIFKDITEHGLKG